MQGVATFLQHVLYFYVFLTQPLNFRSSLLGDFHRFLKGWLQLQPLSPLNEQRKGWLCWKRCLLSLIIKVNPFCSRAIFPNVEKSSLLPRFPESIIVLCSFTFVLLLLCFFFKSQYANFPLVYQYMKWRMHIMLPVIWCGWWWSTPELTRKTLFSNEPETLCWMTADVLDCVQTNPSKLQKGSKMLKSFTSNGN